MLQLELDEESDLVLEKLAEEVIKVKSLDLEVFTKWALRADKCRFKGVSLKEVLMH